MDVITRVFFSFFEIGSYRDSTGILFRSALTLDTAYSAKSLPSFIPSENKKYVGIPCKLKSKVDVEKKVKLIFDEKNLLSEIVIIKI